MKEKGKKIISLSIILFMVLNYLLPLVNYAEFDLGSVKDAIVKGLDENQEEIGREYEIKETEEWDISLNGDRSVIAKWKLEDRSLTISGTGKMKDCNGNISEYWHKKYKRLIEKVIIGNGVTNIGYAAFFGCSSLVDITISNKVTSIGESAFRECSNLKSVNIPNSVTSIGNNAFNGCSILTNVNIPNSVKNIGYYAFEDCSSLTYIAIPNSVTSIEKGAFRGCSSLIEINVSANNKNYNSINGVLYNVTKTQIIKYPANINDKTFTFPNTVNIIGDYAFEGCKKLTSITMTNSVTSIGNNAFDGCSSLTSVNIPNSVTNIGYYAFEDCNSLTNIKIPSSITCIESGLFVHCTSLKSITIPSSVTIIEDMAFEGCSSLTSITIPNSITNIKNSTFYDCSSLTSITIPNSVKKIESSAFCGCTSLKNLTIPNGATIDGNFTFSGVKNIVCKTNSNAHKYAEENEVPYILSDNVVSNYSSGFQIKEIEEWDISEEGDGSVIAKWKLEDKSLHISGTGIMKDWDWNSTMDWHKKYQKLIEKVIIENGITNIGEYIFSNCSSIKNIVIPNSVTSIGKDAFFGCSSLTNITIPNSVTSIGQDAFYGCSSLTSITIPNSITNLKGGIFYTCSNLTNIIIPDSVTKIEYHAFYGCNSLTSITIPNSVTNIDSSAFNNCSNLIEINVLSDNSRYTSINGILFNKEKTNIIRYPSNKEEKEYIIPNTVTTIKSNAFYGCTYLTSITLPNSVTSIEDNTFFGCSSLTSINIPDGVTSIGSHDFEDCSSLTNITIPDSVTSIGMQAFARCSSLTNITIPNSVTSIGSSSFSRCSNLTKISIPSSVTTIGAYAFFGCSKLKILAISNKIESIGSIAFSNVNHIICKTNSCMHKYAEDNELPYLLDEEGPTIELSNNGENIPCKSSSTIVQIKDLKSGLNEEALKYVWSTKETISKDKITKNLTNGKKINTPSNANGNYYLYIYAEDLLQNETIYRSDLFKLDNTAPIVNLEYTTIEKTNQNVTVTLTTNEEIQVVEGWMLSKDKKVLTKIYEQNVGSEEVLVKDIAGNETKQTITITNIDKTSPIITTEYSTIEKTNQNVKVKITSDEEIQSVEGWTLSKDKKVLTKQYEQNVSNEEIIVKDIAGNETKQIITVINIDKIVPTVTVKYSTTEKTTQNVTVALTANEELQEIEGWKISQNKKVLTKEYEDSVTETISIKDIAGNESKQTITINNIDRAGPKINVKYSTTEKTNQNVKVTLTTDEEIEGVEGWTLSEDKKTLTKIYKKNTTETVSLKDLLGNETKQTIKVSNIDKTAPTVTVTYSTKELTNQNVTVTLTTSEEVQEIAGWTLSKDKKVLTKQYEQNVANEEVIVKDIAGNETKQTIEVNNIDKVAPTVAVTYSAKELTNQNVTVTITTSEEVQAIAGWTLSEDKKVLTKEYEDSVTENLTVKDIAGNETKQTIKITNIDKKGPKVEVNYSTTEKTKENVTVTLRTDEEVQDIELEGWTLSDNKKELTKTYTENKTETISLKDKLGNETKLTIEISNIDRISPIVTIKYNTKEITNKNVTVTLTADEELQEVEGWTLSKDKKVLTKQYEQNVANEGTIVKDIAGNETRQTITINNIDKTLKISGDINENNKIDIGDILLIKRHMAYTNSTIVANKHSNWKLSDEKIQIGDLNKNGKIDIGDILKLQRYISASNSKQVAEKHKDWLNLQ